MAFQALLFCPDEKTARTVTQVLSELEFTVEPCTEPFAAVKKLMSGHFDALVVDCDNEQNATLLFKSARNSTSNQTSLAVAIVEGQAGVAKAFRIGANLVLTKPINVEQSKGTLRVARGLLRKGEPVKPGAPATAASAPAATTAVPAKPAAAKPSAPVAATKPAQPAAKMVSAPAVAAHRPIPPVPAKPANVAALQVAASSGLADQNETLEVKGTVPAGTPTPSTLAKPVANKIVPPVAPVAKPPIAPASSFSGGAASAPAPARETHTDVAPAEASPAGDLHPSAVTVEKVTEPEQSAAPAFASSDSVPAPSFTFGGANTAEETDGGRKKIFIGIAAVVLVAVLGFAAYSHFSGGASQSASHSPAAVPAPPAAKPASSQPQAAMPAPVTQPAAASNEAISQPSTADDTNHASEETAAADNTASSVAAPGAGAKLAKATSSANKSAAASKSESSQPAPLVVKSGTVSAAKAAPATPDAPAPSVAMTDSASTGALSGLVSTGTNGLKPVLQQVSVSQGVSQGLLIKRVQPVYPKTALTMRIEGSVELMATISKTGDITGIKVLKGDPQLTKAATDAVKQWKYKPYLLNSEPVEITTQVTINFKLPD